MRLKWGVIWQNIVINWSPDMSSFVSKKYNPLSCRSFYILPSFLSSPSSFATTIFPSRLHSSSQQPAIIFRCARLWRRGSWCGRGRLVFLQNSSFWIKNQGLCATGVRTSRKRTNPRSMRKGRGLSGNHRAVIGRKVHNIPPHRLVYGMWLVYMIKSSAMIGCLLCPSYDSHYISCFDITLKKN